LGSAGAPLLEMGAQMTLKTRHFHVCYLAEFGRSRSNRMGVEGKEEAEFIYQKYTYTSNFRLIIR